MKQTTIIVAGFCLAFWLTMPAAGKGESLEREHKRFYRAGAAIDLDTVLDVAGKAGRLKTVTITYDMARSHLRAQWRAGGKVLGESPMPRGLRRSVSFNLDAEPGADPQVVFVGESGQVRVHSIRADWEPVAASVQLSLSPVRGVGGLAVHPGTRPQVRLLRESGWRTYLNRKVTVTGYYYDGSIPMLIDDFQRVLVDLPIPRSAYLPLAGDLPRGIRWGDRLRLTGLVTTPRAGDPRGLMTEIQVLRLTGGGAPQVLQPSRFPGFQPRAYLKTRDLSRRLVLQHPSLKLPAAFRSYALLISGGINAANNHLRYWNDLKAMHALLLLAGYEKQNITVMYADGSAEDDRMDVDFAATSANLRRVFTDLGNRMTANDSLYIMLNDHGGGFLSYPKSGKVPGFYGGRIDDSGDETDIIKESTYSRDLNSDTDDDDEFTVDECICLWGEEMFDDDFSVLLNLVPRYRWMAVQMKQCFSGGFLRDLIGKNRVILASTRENDLSHAHKDGNYGRFTFHFFSALLGHPPHEPDTQVDADRNRDGWITLREAFRYAFEQDHAIEVPGMSDIDGWGDKIRLARIDRD